MDEREKWGAQGRCKDCGAGMWEDGDTLYVQPHDMGCPVLAGISKREQDGWCTNCGARKIVERGGNLIYGPNGHRHEMYNEVALEALDAAGSGWIREEL